MLLFWGRERRSQSEIRRQAKLVVRCGQRGRVAAWARGCVDACHHKFLWESSLNVGILLYWTFILCNKIENVGRTMTQSRTMSQSNPEYACTLLQYMESVALNACHSCGRLTYMHRQYLLTSSRRPVG